MGMGKYSSELLLLQAKQFLDLETCIRLDIVLLIG